MKLWIIYINSFGYAKMIGEIFETQLEEDFNVSMGNAGIVNPSLVIDEKPDFLIFGVLCRENSPNLIKNWIEEFSEISKSNNFAIKKVAAYYITPKDLDISKIWSTILSKCFPVESVFPKPLFLKIHTFNGALDEETYILIKKYIKDLVNFFFN